MGVAGLRALWVLPLASRLCQDGALAQIYKLEETVLPPNRSMHMLYTYYIYSHEDAPEKTFGLPYVKYHGASPHTSTSSVNNAPLKDYRGIQLSLMKYEDFWNLIDPKTFCCGASDVQKGVCEHTDELLVQKRPGQSYDDVSVYTHHVRFTDTSSNPTETLKDVKISVRETGVYILMLSNCGELATGSITGSVVVKNSYGFLPGNEYHKMPFYGWLALVYMVMAVLWMALSLRWWKEVISIQSCIGAVILLGLVESFVWYIFFTDWNSTGSRGKPVFVLAILSSVAKSIFSYMLVLVASLGWGVSRPYLDKDVSRRIYAVCALYIVLGVIREVVLSFRHSHSVPLSFVLLCLLPVSLLNGVIFYWVFTALSSLIQSLKDRGQTAKLELFQRLWSVLILSLVIATGTLLYQIFALSRSLTTQWNRQWLFTDGVSHLLFLNVLVCMMYLWAPHKDSQRYAYTQFDVKEPDALKDDKPPDWLDEVGDGEDDEEDGFWASTKAQPVQGSIGSAPAETIGVSSSATGVLKNTMEELDRLGVDDSAVMPPPPPEKLA